MRERKRARKARFKCGFRLWRRKAIRSSSIPEPVCSAQSGASLHRPQGNESGREASPRSSKRSQIPDPRIPRPELRAHLQNLRPGPANDAAKLRFHFHHLLGAPPAARQEPRPGRAKPRTADTGQAGLRSGPAVRHLLT